MQAEVWITCLKYLLFDLMLLVIKYLLMLYVGPSCAMLCSQAKEHGLWLVGGSIPEKHTVDTSEEPQIYNTVRSLQKETRYRLRQLANSTNND